MMAALDAAPTCIRRLDSLSRAPGERLEDQFGPSFDVVLSNPPFAGDIGRAHADGYALAKHHRVERDVLFLERAVELLRPGGRLAIVLPHNKVAGEGFGFVRQWLLRQVRVVAVVGLPRETFLPHTAQKACLVVGQKRASALSAVAADERVLLHVSDRAGKDAQGRPVTLPHTPRSAAPWDALDHDLRDAVHAVREHLVEHPWA
jgi:type I restriction enzyme M protein